MRVGYARVSTQDQRPELQLDALAGAGCEQVFQEKQWQGRELGTCLKVLRADCVAS
jgi:DNA invertase Pin-like site-specific DNA recombinase